ncbi:MAG: hypothetical protein R3358_09735, partial [Woeseiaceae bacterium]|nr:hypothetical protein [Woeseiaceae bacterium]
MRKIVRSIAAVTTLGISMNAVGEEFRYAAGLEFSSQSFDSTSIFTTVGPPPTTVVDSTSIDTDTIRLAGQWYFAGLSDDRGPRARAAFVDRASTVALSYTWLDQDFANVRTSDDPFVPPGSFSASPSGGEINLGVRYVNRESGWFGTASLSRADLDVSTNCGGGSVDATGWQVGLGKYFWPTTALQFAYGQVNADFSDSRSFAIAANHLGALGGAWQYGADVTFERRDADIGGNNNNWSAAFSLYPNRDIEFGVRYLRDQQEFNAGVDGYEGFASWYVSPRVRLAAR